MCEMVRTLVVTSRFLSVVALVGVTIGYGCGEGERSTAKFEKREAPKAGSHPSAELMGTRQEQEVTVAASMPETPHKGELLVKAYGAPLTLSLTNIIPEYAINVKPSLSMGRELTLYAKYPTSITFKIAPTVREPSASITSPTGPGVRAIRRPTVLAVRFLCSACSPSTMVEPIRYDPSTKESSDARFEFTPAPDGINQMPNNPQLAFTVLDAGLAVDRISVSFAAIDKSPPAEAIEPTYSKTGLF